MKLKKLLFKDEHEVVGFINNLPKEQRGVIGRIIWWDYYAYRSVGDRTSAFDHWLAEQGDHFNEPADKVLAETLELFGYEPRYALRRVAFKNSLKQGYSCGGRHGRAR